MPTSINGFGFVDDNGNKSIAINLSNCRRMTYSEYQQLSESERSGAIIITDYPIPEESDSASVTGDGVKTYGTLINELYALADISKISENTVITREDPNGVKFVFYINRIQSDNYNFTTIRNTTTDNTTATIWFKSSNSAIIECITTTTETTMNNQSSVAMTSGTKISLIYNYYKNQDIHTEYSAENCYLSNGNTVEDEVLRGYIQVIADGNKTYRELLNSLYALVDANKISRESKIVINNRTVLNIFDMYSGAYTFGNISNIDNGGVSTAFIKLNSDTSLYMSATNNTPENDSSLKPGNGSIITLYY